MFLGHLNCESNNCYSMHNSHKELTTISVSQKNYLILKELGSTGDSFNDVLSRILEDIVCPKEDQNSGNWYSLKKLRGVKTSVSRR
jgi:hypothetical protein